MAATRWRGTEVLVALALPVATGVIGALPVVGLALFAVPVQVCESVDGATACSGTSGGGVAVLVTVLVVALLVAAVAGAWLGTRWLARRVDGRPSR